MAIAKPSRLGLDHVADTALRLHDVVDLAAPGHQPPRRTLQGSPASSLGTRRTPFSEPAPDPREAQNEERFFASQVPPVAPYGPAEHPDRAILQQPKSQTIVQMQAILGLQ
jgi:hypothetical protein